MKSSIARTANATRSYVPCVVLRCVASYCSNAQQRSTSNATQRAAQRMWTRPLRVRIGNLIGGAAGAHSSRTLYACASADASRQFSNYCATNLTKTIFKYELQFVALTWPNHCSVDLSSPLMCLCVVIWHPIWKLKP